jgi:Rps23 Pro-64 3,4-dihydroxylase Tpa1-like proline 4-hydroxylase
MSIPDLSIAAFLPVDRMRELAGPARQSYLAARPFPHVVFDDFLDPALLQRVLDEFPRPGAIRWQSFDNEREVKLASASEASFGPWTRLLLYHLNAITFLEFLSEVTAIDNLIPDPTFDGGGLHQIVPGGKLGIHADFNKHGRFGLDRRLNILVYLNRDWREDYGGHLELWDRAMTKCEVRIAPNFNRMVVFGTTDYTYHGHPDPLRCPEGMTRKSLALYYFSNGRPAAEVSGEHSTLFRQRDARDFRPSLAQRVRAVARELTPPIIARQLRRFL